MRVNAYTMGGHAVAIAGFGTTFKEPTPYGNACFKLSAFEFDRIYVYDDQLGPFARIVFKIVTRNEGLSHTVLSTEWRSLSGRSEVLGIPILILLLLYKEISIPFKDFHDSILELNGILKTVHIQFLSNSMVLAAFLYQLMKPIRTSFQTVVLKSKSISTKVVYRPKSNIRTPSKYDQHRTFSNLSSIKLIRCLRLHNLIHSTFDANSSNRHGFMNKPTSRRAERLTIFIKVLH